MPDLIRPRDIIGNLAVRKMLGRAFREDRKPMTRATLIAWRARRGFPAPLDTPSAGHCGTTRIELWDRQAVKRWIAERGT